jgi:two-component system sensor histidine kinase DctS
MEISIEDDGRGIADEIAGQMFDLGTSGGNGSGWGLALCREFVESANGAIAYEPNVPRGSRFTITLPGVAHRAAA